jgi:siderophore synthetase component
LAPIAFQADVAAIFYDVPQVAPHLSAIIRAPVTALPGETIVPAINLWTGPCEAATLLGSADPDRIRTFFERYCRALMSGPVQFCAEWGMAFEPHLQNVYVRLRDGLPCGVVLRDLDATILDRRRIQPLLDEAAGALAENTWAHMPEFELGERRLVQAMLFGHLGEVMSRLTDDGRVTTRELMAIVEATWSDLEAAAPSAASRKTVARLRGWSEDVKATLRTRLHRARALEFVAR